MLAIVCFSWALILAVTGVVRMLVEVDWIGMMLMAIALFDLIVGVIAGWRERWYD